MKNKVKAFTKVGLMKGDKWINGVILEEYENIYVVETYGNKISLEKRFVKKVEEMPYDEVQQCYPQLNNFVFENWNTLKNNITEAADSFFPEEEININEEDKIIECESLGISITATIKEIETISSFKEVPIWEVVSWETIPSTREEPEDVSERVMYADQSTLMAAKSFVDSMWIIKSEIYWNSK